MEPITLDSFFIEITSRCNFVCPFCPQSIMKRPQKNMSAATAEYVIDQVSENFRIGHMAFHLMGEPLLHPEWDRICRYAYDKGITTAIFTNGSLLTESNISKIFRAGVHVLIISYIGEGEEFLRSRTRTRLSHDNYRQGIEMLIRKKAELVSGGTGKIPRIELHVFNTRHLAAVNTSVISVPEQAVKDVFNRWIQFGESLQHEYGLTPVKNDPGRMGGLIDRPMYESMFHIIEGVSIVPKPGGTFANTMIDRDVQSVSEGTCGMFTGQLGVLSNGEVTCCCFDFEGVLCIGNIHSDSLVNIWNSARAEEYRVASRNKQLIHPFCKRCQGNII